VLEVSCPYDRLALSEIGDRVITLESDTVGSFVDGR
jgi:hypothetical protein